MVRVHLAGQVGVCSHLPTGQVNRLEACLDLLHRLVTGEGAQRIDERLRLHVIPELLCALASQAVLYFNGSPQADNVFRPITTLDTIPTCIA